MNFKATLLLVATALLSTGCVGTRLLSDPTVVIRSEAGTELGVSTDYGIVFLGRSARSGYIEIIAWFGDGPSVESTVVEPVGAGLYTAETDIRLPSVQLAFFQPRPGDELLIVGRDEDGTWESEVEVRSDPRVYGILLEMPKALRGEPDQIGAGVFTNENQKDRKLLGLVSGRLRLKTKDGVRTFLTVMGPDDLWRLVTHRRDRLDRKPWVYREDIL